jgi:hypothetical protein
MLFIGLFNHYKFFAYLAMFPFLCKRAHHLTNSYRLLLFLGIGTIFQSRGLFSVICSRSTHVLAQNVLIGVHFVPFGCSYTVLEYVFRPMWLRLMWPMYGTYIATLLGLALIERRIPQTVSPCSMALSHNFVCSSIVL